MAGKGDKKPTQMIQYISCVPAQDKDTGETFMLRSGPLPARQPAGSMPNSPGLAWRHGQEQDE